MSSRKFISICSAIFTLITVLFSANVLAAKQLLAYHNYPAIVYSAKNAALNFASNPKATAFKSHLLAAAKKKPNFAGHYVLTSWGCGMFCITMAVIDVKTGNIYFLDPTKDNPDWNKHLLGYSFVKPHANSKLLIIKAQLTKLPRASAGSLAGPKIKQTLYYKWQNNKLIFMRKVSTLQVI